MKNKNIFFLCLTVLLLITVSTSNCRAENPAPLSHVYNQPRIDAYKKTIRHFNPSVAEHIADRIAKAIIFYTHKHQLEDDRFVAAVITIESMFNPYAVSRSGAMGLGQLMPGTAQGLKVQDAFNIEQNIDGSCRYLKAQLDRYKHLSRQQQYELALASYNAGPNAVKRWGGIPPYRETQNYVVDVIKVWRQLCGLSPMDRSRIKATQKADIRPPVEKKQVKMSITRTYKTITIHEE